MARSDRRRFCPAPKDWPSFGSIVEYVNQHDVQSHRSLPSYFVLPNSLGRLQEQGQYPRPGEHAGWLGSRYNPLTTKIDKKSLTDNPYWRDCSDEELTFAISGMGLGEGLTIDRLNNRQTLLGQLNSELQSQEGRRFEAGLDAYRERAFSLVTSPEARNALRITEEPASVRDRYGRHLFGQSSLMARRLVEAGVRFVTVHYDCVDGYSWDSHQHSTDVGKHLLPSFDQAYSALISDLDERGLLDETLVVALGEMGRTPTANAQWGRDHWSTLFPCLVAGAGVPGERVIGKSDKDSAYALDQPFRLKTWQPRSTRRWESIPKCESWTLSQDRPQSSTVANRLMPFGVSESPSACACFPPLAPVSLRLRRVSRISDWGGVSTAA